MENKEILKESIEELSKNNFDDSMIKDNKLCFIVGESLYRVRMPNQGEQSLVEHKRNLMQLEYMKQEGCITQKQLIQQLKESGVIDIKQLEEKKEILIKQLRQFWFFLATKDSENKDKIIEYTQKIVDIQDNLKDLSLEIATTLSPCLESRLEKFYLEYLTTICAEQKIGEEWKRVWASCEEFNQADITLANKAIAHQMWLLLNRK